MSASCWVHTYEWKERKPCHTTSHSSCRNVPACSTVRNYLSKSLPEGQHSKLYSHEGIFSDLKRMHACKRDFSWFPTASQRSCAGSNFCFSGAFVVKSKSSDDELLHRSHLEWGRSPRAGLPKDAGGWCLPREALCW